MHTLKRLLIAVLAAAALAVPAHAQSRVDARLAWRQSPLIAGEEAVLGVILEMNDRWHVQAGKGSGDDRPPYIPTTVSLELPDGWTAGEPRWPDAHTFTLGVFPNMETLRGYEGRMLVAVPIQVPGNAAGAEHAIGVTVAYQACDDQVCEMPTSVDASGSIRVVAAGDAVAVDEAPAEVAMLFADTLGRAEHGDPEDDEAETAKRVFGDGERLQAEVLWYEGDLAAGRPATLGVLMHVAPKWHVQAGAGSGDDKPDFIATTVEATLPDGWTSSGARWPEAHEFTIGTGAEALTLAGYDGTFLAIVPVEVPAGATPGDHPVRLEISYQACDDQVCEMPTEIMVVGNAKVLEAGATSTAAPLSNTHARLFEEVLTRAGVTAGADGGGGETEIPHYKPTARFAFKNFKWWGALLFLVLAMGWMTLRTFRITARSVPRVITSVIAVVMVGAAGMFVWQMTTPTDLWVPYSTAAFEQARADGKRVFIKFTADWCANCHVNERIILGSDEAMAELQQPGTVVFKVDFSGEHPDGRAKLDELGGGGIPAIVVYRPGEDEPSFIRGLLAGADPVIAALRGETLTAGADQQVFNFLGWQFTVGKNSTLLILALALLAGFFLNFTPCVLPVIPLKIMSLQAHANDPRRCFVLGFIFGLGIIAAFAVLGVLIAGLIGGIERLDWGGMFSYWWFSGIVGVIVGVMGLGMLGLFVTTLPQWVYMFDPRSDTASGSFFMGVFTAVLSTPCTGPLLGATIAWVILQPKWLAFMTFVVMGIGMALPYVLLTANPSWLERMPRTGPGSELVKQVMGLLLLAVATFFIGIAVQSLLV